VAFKGSPTRDPRAHSLSVSYVVKIRGDSLDKLQASLHFGAALGWDRPHFTAGVHVAASTMQGLQCSLAPAHGSPTTPVLIGH
jgi:ADP-ribose pyrophosphatase YjhB (NUDIX family)